VGLDRSRGIWQKALARAAVAAGEDAENGGRRADDLFLPLVAEAKAVGVLHARLRRDVLLTEMERRVILSLADHAAVALARDRLMREAAGAQALAEADRLKGALLSAVSHDFKTPFASIKASIAALRRRPEITRLPGDALELLEGIEEQANRLNALVSDLLDFSRLESGAWQPAREPYDLGDILGTVLARFDAVAEGRIHVALPDNLTMVEVDGVQIAQVLWNLLDNALKYAPLVTPVTVSAAQDGDRVRITVSDEGPGVDPSEQQRIFEPFYRGGGRSAARGGRAGGSGDDAGTKGTGLGLAICRGLVEAHGGRLWIENRSPTGAAFHLTVPVALKPGAGAKRHDPSYTGGR
jgi:two-component system, OmpR family, sensor histidine kinase KdpD